jgi:uncharacterized membrane protein YgdD (TMEM256/DUF423 family)
MSLERKAKLLVALGAAWGFICVAMGAFGAHGLEGKITDKAMEAYKTGILYGLVHSVMIVLSGGLEYKASLRAGWFFFAGNSLFTLSLIIYALTSIKTFALITPFGGVSYLIGWAVLSWGFFKLKNEKTQ